MLKSDMASQANCLAIHEFGKDLEAQIGRVQFVAVLVFSAYASGLAMIISNHPIGAEALLPVGASGMISIEMDQWKILAYLASH